MHFLFFCTDCRQMSHKVCGNMAWGWTRDLAITGSGHLVIVWGNGLLYTDLHLPNAPILSFIFTVANPSSQQAAFQQRELFFKDDLGLSFSVSISSFALSSANAKCAPDISFFLCGRTDMVSFLLLSLSWHHLGCARGMPQLDITTSSSLTMTISSFTAQRMVFVIAVIYSENYPRSDHHPSCRSACQPLHPKERLPPSPSLFAPGTSF